MAAETAVCFHVEDISGTFSVGRSKEVTGECLRTGVDSRQPLRGAKVWDLQDATVGVHQHIITLMEKETRETQGLIQLGSIYDYL